MKRDYTSGEDEQIEFFTGYEVEYSPAHGIYTMFVVGIHSVEEIVEKSKLSSKGIKHYYFGANQSFSPATADDHNAWDKMICDVMNATKCRVTLDFDVRFAQDILEYAAIEFRKFIPMISVKIPYLRQFNYNATIKIDDIDYDATNPGVWCHSLDELTSRDQFTSWDAYGKDEILK